MFKLWCEWGIRQDIQYGGKVEISGLGGRDAANVLAKSVNLPLFLFKSDGILFESFECYWFFSMHPAVDVF